jgi:predicted TIM-barrel fold metal-dependent hydrolase
MEKELIVDCHVHYRSAPGFLDALVAEYEEWNAAACVLTPLGSIEPVRKAAEQHPRRIVGFGLIDLGSHGPDEVRRFHGEGFRGLKCICPPKNYDDPEYYPVYEEAESHAMTILFHTGFVGRAPGAKGGPHVTLSNDRMRPVYLDTIARRFTGLTLIGAHLGIPWYMEAGDATRWNENLFFDISGLIDVYMSPGWYGHEGVSGARGGRDEGKNKVLFWLDQALWWEGAFKKIVFGTDVAPEHRARERDKYLEIMDALDLDSETRALIMGRTLAPRLRLV